MSSYGQLFRERANENIYNLGMILCYINFFVTLYLPNAITDEYVRAALAMSFFYVSFISTLQILGDPIKNRALYMFSSVVGVLSVLYMVETPN